MCEQDGSQALLLADMHVLPGMDGGPVIDCEGKLVGVLGLPLSSHTFRAEVTQRIYLVAGCTACTVLPLCSPRLLNIQHVHLSLPD